jgi:hypothetical protein
MSVVLMTDALSQEHKDVVRYKVEVPPSQREKMREIKSRLAKGLQ